MSMNNVLKKGLNPSPHTFLGPLHPSVTPFPMAGPAGQLQLVLFMASLPLVFVLVLYLLFTLCRARARNPPRGVTIGFFHPYCHAGGGGERVLWLALASLQAWAVTHSVKLSIVIYTGDREGSGEILGRARERFGVDLVSPTSHPPITFVRIQSRWLLEAAYYPRFTLLGQSLGSMVTALECLWRGGVDVWVDTMGAAFTYPVARYLGGARVVAYVHYPTVSTDMLHAVASQRAAFNNDAAIAASPTLTSAKLGYYRAFASAYGAAGRCACPGGVMANSSWTAAHIKELWGGEVRTVYPPCPTQALKEEVGGDEKKVKKGAQSSSSLAPRANPRSIVSLAQFRPEKDHSMQLAAFAALRALGVGGKKNKYHDVTLEIMGGVRDKGDEGRLEALQREAIALGLPGAPTLRFTPNPPFDYVKRALQGAMVGLHTMAREHFGIVCVEMQAAGCVLVAHDSGGPREDIVVPAWRPRGVGGKGQQQVTGMLASTVEDYTEALEAVFSGRVDCGAISRAARGGVERFSDEAFAEGFCGVVGPVVMGVLGGGGSKSERGIAAYTPSEGGGKRGGKRKGSVPPPRQ